MIDYERANAQSNPMLSSVLQTQTRGGGVTHSTSLLFEDATDANSATWQKINMVPNGVVWFRVLPFRDTVAGMDAVAQ